MYLAGKDLSEISRETGYAESTVKVFLRGLRNSRRFADQYEKEIEELYKQGCKIREIAEKIDMSYAAVNKYLLKNGFKESRSRIWSEEKLQLSDVAFAVPRKVSSEKIRAGNKIYTDVTLQFAGQ